MNHPTPDYTEVSRLSALLEGHLLLPGHEGFQEASTVWNAAIKALPILVVRPASTEQVAQCVKMARQWNLPIAVRSGGHSVAGHGTGNGMVIDLSRMKALNVNPETRMVRLQPGLTWGEVARELHVHGLAITAGDTASVGVGGLLQGGGIGWMVRKHGLAIDRVVSVEVVTCTGEVLQASRHQHPELFWAVRGGGANFGIVTSFEVEAHEGGMVLGGAILFPGEQAREVLKAYREFALTAPDELTTQAMMIAAPPAPFVPSEAVGKPLVGIMVCYSGDPEVGEKVIAPLRRLGTPVVDLLGQMPYPEIFRLSEVGEMRGMRHVVRSQFMQDLADPVIDELVTRTLQVLNPGTLVQLRALGGQMARIAPASTAFAHRDKAYLLMVTHFSPDAAGEGAEQACTQATEHIWAAVQAHGNGAYGNFLSHTEQHRVNEAYTDWHLLQLARVKRQYDPENVFRRNVNVLPQQETAVVVG